jgi:threonine dehydratase
MTATAPAARLPIGLDDVRQAAARIEGGVVRTPSATSYTLSELLGATVVVKFENLQFTASYKERGALNRLLALDPDERARGVVAMSAGNHAQGVAHHAARLGVPATIVMPAFTPAVKVARTRILGAEVVLYGDDLSAAEAEARRLERERRLTFIHPFDDPLIMAGSGTVALELLEDHPEIDVFIVPVGGGGLISGVATVVKALAPGAEVVGAQSDRYPSMVTALGRPAPDARGGATIAEGIAVMAPGHLTLPVVRALVDDLLVIGEADIEIAVGMFAEVEKIVAEGAGAMGVAALRAFPERFAGRTVGVIVSGGNIEPRLLASVLLRGLVRSGRLVTLRVEAVDRPGALAAVSAIVAAEGGNIVEVRHSRLLAELSIRSTQIELTVEMVDRDHAMATLARLTEAGFAAEWLGPQG